MRETITSPSRPRPHRPSSPPIARRRSTPLLTKVMQNTGHIAGKRRNPVISAAGVRLTSMTIFWTVVTAIILANVVVAVGLVLWYRFEKKTGKKTD